METKIKLTCARCGKEFEMLIGQYNYWTRKGRTEFYCGHSCASKKLAKTDKYKIRAQTDEFSPFRHFITVTKKAHRNKGRGFNLTVQYLKNLWDEQKGLCAITGIPLLLQQNSNNKKRTRENMSPTQASLDRINSDNGYIEGNVRFVALSINYAKHIFSDEQLDNFLKILLVRLQDKFADK